MRDAFGYQNHHEKVPDISYLFTPILKHSRLPANLGGEVHFTFIKDFLINLLL